MSDGHSIHTTATQHKPNGRGRARRKRRPHFADESAAFWWHVRKTEDCWHWEGFANVSGPVFIFCNKRLVATRVAWRLCGLVLEDSTRLSHTCGNDRCVRPEHMRTSTIEDRFWRYVAKTDGCWEWQGCRTDGPGSNSYGRIGFQGHLQNAHRVAWMLHHGPIPDGLLVLHRCDNMPCVNPDHLFLGTHQDNVDDMVRKRRHVHGDRQWMRTCPPELRVRGERNGHHKLTEEQVRAIRQRFAAGGVSKMQLAREYGISHLAIRMVISRRTWAHVE